MYQEHRRVAGQQRDKGAKRHRRSDGQPSLKSYTFARNTPCGCTAAAAAATAAAARPPGAIAPGQAQASHTRIRTRDDGGRQEFASGRRRTSAGCGDDRDERAVAARTSTTDAGPVAGPRRYFLSPWHVLSHAHRRRRRHTPSQSRLRGAGAPPWTPRDGSAHDQQRRAANTHLTRRSSSLSPARPPASAAPHPFGPRQRKALCCPKAISTPPLTDERGDSVTPRPVAGEEDGGGGGGAAKAGRGWRGTATAAGGGGRGGDSRGGRPPPRRPQQGSVVAAAAATTAAASRCAPPPPPPRHPRRPVDNGGGAWQPGGGRQLPRADQVGRARRAPPPVRAARSGGSEGGGRGL